MANIDRADWLVWVDDDVYFMDHERSLRDFLPEEQETNIVFCDSPVNEKGEWTILNSGVILIKNTLFSKQFFLNVANTPVTEVESWWDREQYGLFTNGDQDCIVYQCVKNDLLGTKVKIIPHKDLNARIYHFRSTAKDCFLCHLAGVDDKRHSVRELKKKFHLSDCLTPKEYYDDVRNSYAYSMFSDDRKKPSLKRRAKDIAKKILKKIRG